MKGANTVKVPNRPYTAPDAPIAGILLVEMDAVIK